MALNGRGFYRQLTGGNRLDWLNGLQRRWAQPNDFRFTVQPNRNGPSPPGYVNPLNSYGEGISAGTTGLGPEGGMTPLSPYDSAPGTSLRAPAPVNRPTAQFYDQAALTAVAPYSSRGTPNPRGAANAGWYTPREIDRFASVMGPDQLRGLMPLILAARNRMQQPVTTPAKYQDFSDFQRQMYAANPNVPHQLVNQDAYNADPGSRPGETRSGDAGVWQALARMFPGLGQQTNGLAQELFPGIRFQTAEGQAAANAQKMKSLNAEQPPGPGMEWYLNPRDPRRPGSGGYQQRRIPTVPGARPASYRGGMVRR